MGPVFSDCEINKPGSASGKKAVKKQKSDCLNLPMVQYFG
jgi:hypothetical protein